MTTDSVADLALGRFAAGVLTTFGVRTWAHRRRTGSSGSTGTSGPRGSAGWWGGVLFVAAPVLAAARVRSFVPGVGRTTTATRVGAR